MAEYYRCSSAGMFVTLPPKIVRQIPYQDPVLFTGTIASNIAYGFPDATREQIEDAARQANCEFVWGMPRGFDTESKYNISIVHVIISDKNVQSRSRTTQLERRPTATPRHRPRTSQEACYLGTGRGD